MPSVRLNHKNLDALIKAFKKKPSIRVGVLVAKNARPADEESETIDNVKLGSIHEFGQGSQPMRSFLRMPISTKLQDSLEASGAFDKKALKKVVEEKSLIPWAKGVGVAALETVLDAFATGGFGLWPASDMKRKKNKQTLVENTHLRDSIGWDVK